MYAPLFEQIKKLTGKYPMHMPGHKRNAAFLPKDLLDLDITEIGESDNLHAPSGVIMLAQREMARLYGCDESIFCVNGGSSGVLAAVLGTCGESDTILAVKNAHKSLHNALILSGADAVYMNVETSPYGYALPAKADMIEKALSEVPDIKAVFIVSPTYEGFCADIRKIAETVHRHNKILIVDETHGAHFPFCDIFPESAAKSGADISVVSWHKTMPVPNQCAVLNINTQRVDFRRVKQAFSMVTTTSPSYIFMGLMDYVRAYYAKNAAIFKEYAKTMQDIRNPLSTLKNIHLANDKAYSFDISKLTLVSDSKNIKKTAGLLEEKYGFALEMKGLYHIIAMTSVADDPNELRRFSQAVKETDACLETEDMPKTQPYEYGISKKINQRRIFYSPKEFVDIEDAEGRIAADFITPFPPDIPCIIAGEKITHSQIDSIKNMPPETEILGLAEQKTEVLK